MCCPNVLQCTPMLLLARGGACDVWVYVAALAAVGWAGYALWYMWQESTLLSGAEDVAVHVRVCRCVESFVRWGGAPRLLDVLIREK